MLFQITVVRLAVILNDNNKKLLEDSNHNDCNLGKKLLLHYTPSKFLDGCTREKTEKTL